MVDSHTVNHDKTIQETFLYESSSHDVYLNLAREEYLFDSLPEGSRAFLLYVNAPAVVFGKHQNPWKECAVADLRRRGVPLARRISGGGTVYHDLGNLNFSFILPKEGFDRRRNLETVVDALSSLGLEAEVSDRHDVTIGGKKVSGNAFCFRKNRALHHGTLLIRSRLNELRGSLAGIPGIETFAVASNPSPVTNIADVDSAVTIDRVSAALIREVQRRWVGPAGGEPVHIEETRLTADEVLSLWKRNREPEWIFDRTPQFTVRFVVPGKLLHGARPEGGRGAELLLRVEHGRVVEEGLRELSGFTLQERELLAEWLGGVRFKGDEVASALGAIPAFTQVADWIRHQGF